MSLQAYPIRNVADTAYWVATYRTMESERPNALFHRRLGGERGEAIVKTLPRGPVFNDGTGYS